MIKLRDEKVRKTFSLYELVEAAVGDEPVDWEILSVVDEHGNINSTECDVVVEVTYSDEDKDELTPDEQNDELRRLGF